jgi:hypothetical protein
MAVIGYSCHGPSGGGVSISDAARARPLNCLTPGSRHTVTVSSSRFRSSRLMPLSSDTLKPQSISNRIIAATNLRMPLQRVRIVPSVSLRAQGLQPSQDVVAREAVQICPETLLGEPL